MSNLFQLQLKEKNPNNSDTSFYTALRQRCMIRDALAALETMRKPGTVQELSYQWKRPDPE